MDAAPERRLQRRSSVNILTAWPGRVASATRAGRARDPWSCSPCWRPSRDGNGVGDQLGLDGEAFSKMEDGSDLGTCRPQVTSVGDLPASSVSAPQLIPGTLGSAPHPPYPKRTFGPASEGADFPSIFHVLRGAPPPLAMKRTLSCGCAAIFLGDLRV